MSPQLAEAGRRAWLTLAAIIAAGLLAILPQLGGHDALGVNDMIRAFAFGAAGAFIKRFLAEGLFDSKRNDNGNTIPGDVKP